MCVVVSELLLVALLLSSIQWKYGSELRDDGLCGLVRLGILSAFINLQSNYELCYRVSAVPWLYVYTANAKQRPFKALHSSPCFVAPGYVQHCGKTSRK
jgi:hypothetical protein